MKIINIIVYVITFLPSPKFQSVVEIVHKAIILILLSLLLAPFLFKPISKSCCPLNDTDRVNIMNPKYFILMKYPDFGHF